MRPLLALLAALALLFALPTAEAGAKAHGKRCQAAKHHKKKPCQKHKPRHKRKRHRHHGEAQDGAGAVTTPGTDDAADDELDVGCDDTATDDNGYADDEDFADDQDAADDEDDSADDDGGELRSARSACADDDAADDGAAADDDAADDAEDDDGA
jgi:hypothetical protein